MPQHTPHSPAEISQRKRRLLAEGAVHRASLAASLYEVKQSLRAESLAKRAAGFALSAMVDMIKGRAAGGFGWQAALPLAMNALSGLSKKSLLRKFLRAAAVAATIAGAVNLFKRNKKSRGQEGGPDHAG
ncbi:MAG TPA: hypothetical protein VEC06_17375 [Paucimonas sp.]|nr:hypothetical protein [Paucimonas sp.]